MQETLKKVLDYLLPRLVILLCLPAAYLGIYWLIGIVIGMPAKAASRSAPPMDAQMAAHPIWGGLMVFAFFDSALVLSLGLAPVIVASVLWLVYLAVGTSLPRKLIALALLLLAVAGIHFANAIVHG